MKFQAAIFLLFISKFLWAQTTQESLRIGIVGLTHTHVHWILDSKSNKDIHIVGIVEKNKDLAKRYMDEHGYSMDLVFDSIEEMMAKSKPEAVAAFGSIYEHLEVVEKCAPLGIHVMVEKPLAVSLEHAQKMQKLVEKHNIILFTNYETTWYPTNKKVFDLYKEGKIGALRKVVVHDGHQGPKDIGVNHEFLEWLIDPAENGGGAVTDFGCYGANLITGLTNGERPISVMAMLQSNNDQAYPLVDDEASIILEYKGFQAIIQASWNWPYSRKDMEIYGTQGALFADDRTHLRYKYADEKMNKSEELEELTAPFNDPFSLFASMIKGKLSAESSPLSSIQNNMLVVEILEAAKLSAVSGRRIYFGK